jgi:hypothetical protein
MLAGQADSVVLQRLVTLLGRLGFDAQNAVVLDPCGTALEGWDRRPALQRRRAPPARRGPLMIAMQSAKRAQLESMLAGCSGQLGWTRVNSQQLAESGWVS